MTSSSKYTIFPPRGIVQGLVPRCEYPTPYAGADSNGDKVEWGCRTALGRSNQISSIAVHGGAPDSTLIIWRLFLSFLSDTNDLAF